MMNRALKEDKFFRAIRGVDDSCIDTTIVPRPVKFLATEMSLLGEIFVGQALERHSLLYDSDQRRVLLSFDGLVQVLLRF
jgi:hypothetical protein